MECHHNPWTTNTVELHQPCHVIIALHKHTWSEEIKHSMRAWALDRTHGLTTLGVAWVAHMFG